MLNRGDRLMIRETREKDSYLQEIAERVGGVRPDGASCIEAGRAVAEAAGRGSGRASWTPYKVQADRLVAEGGTIVGNRTSQISVGRRDEIYSKIWT